MKKAAAASIDRRELLVWTAPACAMACLGLGRVPGLAAALAGPAYQETHKFDLKADRSVSMKELAQMSNRSFFAFVNTLREEMKEKEVIRLLNVNSDKIGRQQGETQAATLPDTSFKTFVAQFRPPAYAEALTHEVVVDTEDVFELRVTECLWATVFREAGMDGEIGHAAVCNMDYSWPTAFNSALKMERSKTLMRGQDCCNHRYINTALE